MGAGSRPPRRRGQGQAREDAFRCRMRDGTELVEEGPKQGYDPVRCARCGFAFAPDLDGSAARALSDVPYTGLHGDAPEEGWADPGFGLTKCDGRSSDPIPG